MLLGDTGGLVIGVPLPSLSFEYLLENTVLPFGRMTQILGKEGSCKSGLAMDMVRWVVVQSGGVGCLFENESKFSPDWALSIIGWEYEKMLAVLPCRSMNDWQKRLLKTTRELQLAMDIKNGGMLYPVLMIVDSIMGKSLEESQDRVTAAGFAGRDFAVEAASITKFMRAYPHRILEWPFHLVCINHLRPKMDPHTKTVDRDRAGGRGKEFQETFELEVSRVKDLRTTKYDGLGLKIKCYKNSLGSSRRTIPVEVRWWREEIPCRDNDWLQVTEWCWDASTVDMLASLVDSEKARVRDVIDISVSGNRGYSKRLGVKSSEPISKAELGKMIHSDPVLMAELRRALGIKVRDVFKPGVDYFVQRGVAKGQLAAAYKQEMSMLVSSKTRNKKKDDNKKRAN